MYAIIHTGGKQAKVSEGDVLSVELIKDTDKVTYTPLLIVADDGTVIADPAKLDLPVPAEFKLVPMTLADVEPGSTYGCSDTGEDRP